MACDPGEQEAVAKAGIASLPAELLADVFGCFQRKGIFKDLGNFALVCKDWQELAQHALFSVLFLTERTKHRATAWLNSPARERYRVIGLTYRTLDPVMESEHLPTYTSTDCLVELLRILQLPNLVGLRHLTIHPAPAQQLSGEIGRDVLEECEKRNISVLYRSGTRDMLAEAA
ncbi:hypothetical protein RQP46_002768 [Phenoliferia psychrophenolica]